jgi:hypothetical protein
MKRLGVFPLLASWNEFARTPMEVRPDGSVTKLRTEEIHTKQITTQHIYESITQQQVNPVTESYRRMHHIKLNI